MISVSQSPVPPPHTLNFGPGGGPVPPPRPRVVETFNLKEHELIACEVDLLNENSCRS